MYILCLYVLRESQQTHVEPQVTQAEDGKKAAHNLEDSKATSWDDSIFVVKSLEQKRPICYAAYLTQWETGHYVPS